MNRSLLDAIGKIDPRYIEEAAGPQKHSARSAAKAGSNSEAPTEGAPLVLRSRRRTGWAAAAAALFLAAALGTGWLLLSRKGGADGPANAPVQSSETLLTSSEAGEDPEPSDTREELLPAEDLGRNARDLDFDALIAGTDSEELAEACRWLKTRTPSAKNEMTGLFAGKNLVFITAQSFSPYVIDPERTPTLYRLATQGIEFTDYYQPDWGGGTASGEFAVLTGLAPAHGVQSTLDTVGKSMNQTLGNQLMALGYHSWAFSDESADTFRRAETHGNLGYEEVRTIETGLEELLTKQHPYSDREMMLQAGQIIYDWTPSNVYLMMNSGMGPYHRRSSAMAEKHWAEVEDLPYSDTVKAYLAANMEVELALRDLVEGLELLGVADDYVIVLTSSQYPYALEQNEDWGNSEDYLAELYGKPVENCFERDRSTLIVWSGCLEGKGYKVTTPVSSLDILPTLSNLFGLDYDSRLLVGRDVFSDQEPLVFWPDGSWKTEKGSYLAETGTSSAPDGSSVDSEYVSARAAEIAAKTRYSKAVLETDLFSRLLPARPCQVVRDALNQVREEAYTISLLLWELREDETEKQRLLAGDLRCAMARDGFGANLSALTGMDPEDLSVVHACYDVEYDHTKVSYRDGFVDQYFCLTRGKDGNWSIYSYTSTELTGEPDPGTVVPAETVDAEPQFPPETSLEELEALLGYGWKLPEAGSYSGEIVSKYDESLGENGGILLEYRFDGCVVYAMKYADDRTDLYESWAQGSAERGSEWINGVEVRFLGEPTVPDAIDTAIWKRDGYQYILNCATAPGVDLRSILPLFMEEDAT